MAPPHVGPGGLLTDRKTKEEAGLRGASADLPIHDICPAGECLFKVPVLWRVQKIGEGLPSWAGCRRSRSHAEGGQDHRPPWRSVVSPPSFLGRDAASTSQAA